MKKIFIGSLINLFLFAVPTVFAMESAQQNVTHGASFFKALHSGLRSYKSKISKNEQAQWSVALDLIKLIMDCNSTDFYARVHAKLYDTKKLSETIKLIQRAVDLSEKQNLKLKPSNIIKDAVDGQKFIAYFIKHKDSLIADSLKNNYIEKAQSPLKIIQSNLFKEYVNIHSQTDFQNILKATYAGLQEVVIQSLPTTDIGHYGKKENQLGSLAEIEFYIEDIIQLDRKLSPSIKKAIIDQLLFKIDQIHSRTGYILEHTSASSSASSEEEQSNSDKTFYRWDLKGLAFELEMLIKIVGLEEKIGKLTHYNYTITDEQRNYQEITEFDFITEKAVVEVKAAFLNRNNPKQMTKAKNQLRNQFNAIQKYNLPKLYVFIGSTESLSLAYCNHVLDDVLNEHGSLNISKIIFMPKADNLGAVKLKHIRKNVWFGLEVSSVTNNLNAERLRKISERANYLRTQVGITLVSDESSAESESSSQRTSIDSSNNSGSSNNNDALIPVSTVDEEPAVNSQPTHRQSSSLQDLPDNIKLFMKRIRQATTLNPASYFGYQITSKL